MKMAHFSWKEPFTHIGKQGPKAFQNLVKFLPTLSQNAIKELQAYYRSILGIEEQSAAVLQSGYLRCCVSVRISALLYIN